MTDTPVSISSTTDAPAAPDPTTAPQGSLLAQFGIPTDGPPTRQGATSTLVAAGLLPSPQTVASLATAVPDGIKPGIQTSEGKLVIALVAILQAIAGCWGLLASTGVIHPSQTIAAAVPGAAEALAAWLVQQYSGDRAALKAASLTAFGPNAPASQN